MKSIFSLLIATALLTTSATASTDPFVGKWKLDTQHSSYPAGTCPKEMVIEMEAAGQGVRYRSHSTYANGRTSRAEYTAEYNGKQAVVMGDHGLLLPVSLQRIDPRTVVASYTRGLQVFATSRRVISSDGRRMTITTKSRDQDRKNVTTVGVYERK
jgi:hypothetical protein